MTPFASVALFRRDGKLTFKAPRKERPQEATQARKAAIRFWRGNLNDDDKLLKVIVLREVDGVLEISERGPGQLRDRAWVSFTIDVAAAHEPHIAACLRELGIDPQAAPAPMPDVLVINGATYRRDI